MYVLVQSLVTHLPDVKQQMFLWMIINTSRTRGTVMHFQWLHLLDCCVNHCSLCSLSVKGMHWCTLTVLS